MPGLVAFRRRWSIGSDDLTGPAVTLCAVHIIWVVVLASVLCTAELRPPCSTEARNYGSGTVVIMSACSLVEAVMAFVSARGTILDQSPRASMPYIIYARGVLMLVELGWTAVGAQWLVSNADDCSHYLSWSLLAGAVATNFLCIFAIIVTQVAVFDSTGGAFAKVKSMQKASAADEHAEPLMSWIATARARVADRHLKQLRHKKWERRLNATLCCRQANLDDDARDVFKQVAMLVSTFFEDLDLVLSDVVCAVALLRMYQKHREKTIVEATSNDVYQYLCGMPVSPRTRFLALRDDKALSEYKQLAHFAKYAEACYGWQGYYLTHCCAACCRVGICCISRGFGREKRPVLDEHRSRFTGDNCCMCNYTAIMMAANISPADIVYGCYENVVAQPSFFVVLDHAYKKVVVCIRGTLSISDVLTDLLADAEEINVEPRKPSWFAHKGMLNSANNIRKKLLDEGILLKAFEQCPKEQPRYGLLVVGHSLGAGAAAVLAILLQQDYGNVHCYAYSPPGGLLSHAAAKETSGIITSVVLGKDIVCRLGLSQMEHFRADILRVLKACHVPKWKILCTIGRQDACCVSGCCCLTTADMERVAAASAAGPERDCRFNPFSSKLLLSSHVPMFLPGRIVHIVRNYPKPGGKSASREPVYQAIWADAAAFDEIVVSPKMFTDHMPSHVSRALEKVLQSCGPRKPDKLLSASQRQVLLLGNECGDLQDLLQRHATRQGGADGDERSLESGLSWEYTCQSEAASVALRSPSGLRPVLASVECSANGPITHGHVEEDVCVVPVTVTAGAAGAGTSSTTSRASIIHAIPLAQVCAPVASVEDLRSVTYVGSGTVSTQSSPADASNVTGATSMGPSSIDAAACAPLTLIVATEPHLSSTATGSNAAAACLSTAFGVPAATVTDQLKSVSELWQANGSLQCVSSADDDNDCSVTASATDARVRRLLASPSGEHYVLAFGDGDGSPVAAARGSRTHDRAAARDACVQRETAALLDRDCHDAGSRSVAAEELQQARPPSTCSATAADACSVAMKQQQLANACDPLVASGCAQHEYSLFNDHYSRAGRGYPHGSHHRPSVSFLQLRQEQRCPAQNLQGHSGGAGPTEDAISLPLTDCTAK